jgi:hypothetical protein
VLFIEVPEAKHGKNRIHFDLRRPDGSGWVVLADPEGNEFCILRSDPELIENPPSDLADRP